MPITSRRHLHSPCFGCNFIFTFALFCFRAIHFLPQCTACSSNVITIFSLISSECFCFAASPLFHLLDYECLCFSTSYLGGKMLAMHTAISQDACMASSLSGPKFNWRDSGFNVKNKERSPLGQTHPFRSNIEESATRGKLLKSGGKATFWTLWT